MPKKSVLVTGGCGFIGRHLVRDLLKDSNEIWILDNIFTGKHPDTWLGGFTKKDEGNFTVYEKANQLVIFIQQDAIDFFRNSLMGNVSLTPPNFDEVYHLAAIVGGRAVLIENDPMMIATNHIIDSLFFLWAVKNKEKIGNILYTSSSVAYPKAIQNEGNQITHNEDHLTFTSSGYIGLPESIYGWVKIAGEYLARVAAKKYGLSTACVRPFNGYGEDQDLLYPIPSIAARAARRENPLTVWGSGNQSRDFVYIDDLVQAFRIVIKKIHDGSAVNIGMGKNTTFKEVAHILATLEGYQPTVVGLTNKIEGSFALRADIKKLKSLGWQPKYSLEDGFLKVLQEVKKQSG